jgi:hypothetical protein
MPKKNTPQTVGNQFGYLCPKCHKGNRLAVSFHGSCKLVPDGTDDSGDHEWDGDSMAWCNACTWEGRVKELEQAENFEEE